MLRSFIATNEMQSVSDHSLSGRAEKNSVPRRNRSLEDGTIERSPHPVAPLEDLEAAQISALDDTEGSFRLRLEPILS